MLFPNIRAGIEELHPLASVRIGGLCLIAFRNIAVRAGQAQVLGGSVATSGSRTNMIEMKRLPNENLGRVAIFTSPGRTRFDLSGHRSGNFGAHLRAFLRFGSACLEGDFLSACRKRL
jgi:hypothetical protein